MKLTNKYMMFATAALLLASCDLDKYPEGQYVSDNQKEETIKDRPNLVTAEVNAMAAKLNAYGTISMMRQPIIMIMESRLSLWRWSLEDRIL